MRAMATVEQGLLLGHTEKSDIEDRIIFDATIINIWYFIPNQLKYGCV